MKSKATYKFIDFIRPGGYWPHPYSIEQAFGVFSWMLKTGESYHDQGRWGRHDVRSLLSCKPTCVNFSEVDPIASVKDLERRFHYAILDDCVGPNLGQWRHNFGVTPTGRAIIHFPHDDGTTSNASARDGLDALMNATGRLGVQLNEYHPLAREICGVRLHWRHTWRFVLDYGYQGSVWHRTLSRQLPKETFYTAFRRAQRALCGLVDGIKKPAA